MQWDKRTDEWMTDRQMRVGVWFVCYCK